MRRHRTTARGVLFLAATIGLAAGTAVALRRDRKVPEHIIFPVVGKVQYIDDFGAPRPRWRASGERPHGGEAVACSRRRGRQGEVLDDVKRGRLHALPLRRERHDVLYIHLNNDLTLRNDNRGKCVNGTAYAVKNGAQGRGRTADRVRRRLRRCERRQPHLHFEVHPGRRHARSARIRICRRPTSCCSRQSRARRSR